MYFEYLLYFRYHLRHWRDKWNPLVLWCLGILSLSLSLSHTHLLWPWIPRGKFYISGVPFSGPFPNCPFPTISELTHDGLIFHWKISPSDELVLARASITDYEVFSHYSQITYIWSLFPSIQILCPIIKYGMHLASRGDFQLPLNYHNMKPAPSFPKSMKN